MESKNKLKDGESKLVDYVSTNVGVNLVPFNSVIQENLSTDSKEDLPKKKIELLRLKVDYYKSDCHVFYQELI